MVTERKIRANRLNSKASTGPKSSLGKSASKRNALKHGLSVDLATLPDFHKQVNLLAKLLAPLSADSEHRSQAIEAATAELEILRIRKYRAMLASGPAYAEVGGRRVEVPSLSNDILDRYERRAFSRRARALGILLRQPRDIPR
jgi:hypothetical protein